MPCEGGFPCANPRLNVGRSSTVRSESVEDDPLLSRYASMDWEEGPARSDSGTVKVKGGSVFSGGDESTAGTRKPSSSPGLGSGEGADVGAVV